MADFRAIETVSEALGSLLLLGYDPEDFGGHRVDVLPYAAADFADPMARGVSLYLYRITINGANRTPAGRRSVHGERAYPRLPIDLHYLATVWAADAATQHRITGWMMRTFEDAPILPHGFLEALNPGVFDPDEAVELVAGDLPNEDLFRIWETVTELPYRLSIPYVARNVRIRSRLVVDEGGPMHTRVFDLRRLKPTV